MEKHTHTNTKSLQTIGRVSERDSEWLSLTGGTGGRNPGVWIFQAQQILALIGGFCVVLRFDLVWTRLDCIGLDL